MPQTAMKVNCVTGTLQHLECSADQDLVWTSEIAAIAVLLEPLPDGIDKTLFDSAFTCPVISERRRCRGNCIWNPASSVYRMRDALDLSLQKRQRTLMMLFAVTLVSLDLQTALLNSPKGIVKEQSSVAGMHGMDVSHQRSSTFQLRQTKMQDSIGNMGDSRDNAQATKNEREHVLRRKTCAKSSISQRNRFLMFCLATELAL